MCNTVDISHIKIHHYLLLKADYEKLIFWNRSLKKKEPWPDNTWVPPTLPSRNEETAHHHVFYHRNLIIFVLFSYKFRASILTTNMYKQNDTVQLLASSIPHFLKLFHQCFQPSTLETKLYKSLQLCNSCFSLLSQNLSAYLVFFIYKKYTAGDSTLCIWEICKECESWVGEVLHGNYNIY